MLKVLVVDDEKIERDGIILLLKNNKFPLDIAEAENGEKALVVLNEIPVDILFTDIKMPFMDGLELARKARELYPDLKIIFFSAFDDFSYAKEAINLGAIHYILKPVDFSEFADVFRKVIDICESEQKEREDNGKMMEVYHKGILYGKERLLQDLINGNGTQQDFLYRAELFGLSFKNRFIQLVLIDTHDKFFDLNNTYFKQLVSENILKEFEYLNLNDRQSILFITSLLKPTEKETISKSLESIINTLKQKFGLRLTIIVGNPVDNLEDIQKMAEKIDNILEYKFFLNDSTILFCGNEEMESPLSETIEEISHNVIKYIGSNDIYNVDRSIDMFFNALKKTDINSIIFVKYLCAEIVKKIIEKFNKNDMKNYKLYIEQIFKCDTLYDLESSVKGLVSVVETIAKPTGSEGSVKIIKDVLALIEKNYMKDISLEWVAEKVFLAPSYLSYLFKKEIGQSFVKYIVFYRLEKAKELLMDTNMKVADISEAVGYCNSSYFCLSFKENFGISPAQFRQKC